MHLLAYAVAALLVALGTETSPSDPSPTATPTPGDTATPAATICHIANAWARPALQAAAASPASSGFEGGLAVMIDPYPIWHEDRYTISLFTGGARLLTRVQSAARDQISCDVAGAGSRGSIAHGVPVTLPSVSTSQTRVYYLDGDTDVRYLTPAGVTGPATQVPGGPGVQSTFAVSPDDRHIAVAVFDYRRQPVSVRAYVEDMDGKNHVELATNALTVWTAGWNAGEVVLGVLVSPYREYGFYSPVPPSTGFLMADPHSGGLTGRVGSPDCFPSASLLSPAGVVCSVQQTASHHGALKVLGWSGDSTTWSDDTFSGGALSLDGTTMAVCCVNGPYIKLLRSPAGGGTASVTAAQGYPPDGGWLDQTHLVYRESSRQAIYDTSNGASNTIELDGVLVARLAAGPTVSLTASPNPSVAPLPRQPAVLGLASTGAGSEGGIPWMLVLIAGLGAVGVGLGVRSARADSRTRPG